MMPSVNMPAYTDLQNIRSDEKSRLPFKGFFQPVTIDSTASLNKLKMYRIVEAISEKEFHPSSFRRILILLFIGLFFFLFILLITHPQKNIESYIIPIIFIVFFISFFLYEGIISFYY